MSPEDFEEPIEDPEIQELVKTVLSRDKMRQYIRQTNKFPITIILQHSVIVLKAHTRRLPENESQVLLWKLDLLREMK